MENGWTKRLAELENELKLNASMLAKQTDLAREAEIQRDDWKREWRLLNAAELKAEERIKELEMLINFVPDGWEMPLGWSDLVAQVRGEDEPL